jgi:enoyl-CoA hydratase
MDRVMVGELNQVVPVLAADPEIRAIVFTGGINGVFIQHYDVAELHALARSLRERGLKFDPARPSPDTEVNKLFRALGEMDKPAIAAINGNAMGGGFEFCLACDIRIAERGPYSLGLPEINIGILPGAGGTQRLARLIGEARALELLLRGRTVNPDEALALGMVHETTDGPVLRRALHVAHELAGKSPLAVKHIKRLVRGMGEAHSEERLPVERTLFLDLLVSDAAQKLLEQFLTGARDIRTR